MDNTRFLELINKMESGTATKAELLELDLIYAEFENKPGFTDQFSPQEKVNYSNNLFARISNRTSSLHQKKQFTITPALQIVTASIVIVISAAIFYLNKTKITPHHDVQLSSRHDISPGTNKAILTLSDGSRLSLTDAASGNLAGETEVKLTKTKNGELVYEPSASAPKNDRIAYNTIATPRGGQYHVVLPDGTHAWLNAGSSLSYPLSFSKEGRKVKMTGEVYFEVAKLMKDNHRIPFTVVTEKQQVEVLGTHFNVNAYQDEPVVKTTLAEGSVKVKPNGMAAQFLKPGEQSVLSEGIVKIQHADVDNVLAWKRGFFRFQDDDFKTVIQQLERWYDVDITYKNIPSLHFNGGISRNVPLSQVLKMLEITGGISFTISDRNVKIRLAK